MVTLQQYQRVQVRQLMQPTEAYDGWCVSQRPPRVGDVGTIVDILPKAGRAAQYIVECSAADGNTIWLGDFHAEELEPLAESVRYPVPDWLAQQNLASWREVAAFFESFVASPHGILAVPLLRLIRPLLTSEIAQAFRAGQSRLRLKISTAKQHGLKPGEPFVCVSPSEEGQRLLLEYWDMTGGKALDNRLCPEEEAASPLSTMLDRLWSHRRE